MSTLSKQTAHRKRWRETDDNRVWKLYSRGKTSQQISDKVGRSEAAIKSRLRHLQQYKSKSNNYNNNNNTRNITRARCRWSNKDDRDLLNLVKLGKSYKFIALKLRRTQNAITSRLHIIKNNTNNNNNTNYEANDESNEYDSHDSSYGSNEWYYDHRVHSKNKNKTPIKHNYNTRYSLKKSKNKNKKQCKSFIGTKKKNKNTNHTNNTNVTNHTKFEKYYNYDDDSDQSQAYPLIKKGKKGLKNKSEIINLVQFENNDDDDEDSDDDDDSDDLDTKQEIINKNKPLKKRKRNRKSIQDIGPSKRMRFNDYTNNTIHLNKVNKAPIIPSTLNECLTYFMLIGYGQYVDILKNKFEDDVIENEKDLIILDKHDLKDYGIDSLRDRKDIIDKIQTHFT